MKTLVWVEHDGTAVKDATLSAVTAASKLGEVHLLVAGQGVDARRAGRREDRRRRQGPRRRRRGLRACAGRERRAAGRRADGPSRRVRRARDHATARTSRRASPRCSTSCRSATSCRSRGRTRSRGRSTPATRSRPCRPRDKKMVITVRGTAFDKAAAEGGIGHGRGGRVDRRHGPVDLRRGGDRAERAARADQRQDHRLGRPRAGLGRAVPRADRPARRQARRRRRRQPRGGRRGLCAQRLSGRPDRQDRRARSLCRGRHLRRDPASGGDEGLARPSSPSTRTRTRRSSRSPTSAWSATCSRSCRS